MTTALSLAAFSGKQQSAEETPNFRFATIRPLRPLLPKSNNGSNAGSVHEPKLSQKGCGLTQCPNPDCKLKSHRMYSLTMRQRRLQNTARQKRFRALLIDWNEQSASWVDRRLYDGMPELPEETCQLIESKELFHHFFTQQMDKVRQIYVPFVEAEEYRRISLTMALSNALHCVCILANAKTDIIMRRLSNTPDRGSYAVYSLAASFLRRKLDNFSKEEIDFLLMLVVALAGLDYAFERFEALSAHRDALERLVSMQGGLHVIDDYQSQVVAYVSKTDHMLATSLGKPPLFNQEFGSHTFKLPDSPSGKYGAVWRDPATLEYIDEDVANMCLDSCRLIHMAESEGIAFYQGEHDAIAADAPSMPFFVFLRGRVGSDYGRLYTLYHPNQTSDTSMHTCKSRCLVYACVLTDYNILWGDYYPMYRHRKASNLLKILESQPPNTWNEHIDMLTWILFVLTSAVPRTWREHKKAIDMLQDTLAKKYNDHWPRDGWEEEELDNLRRHMWSDLAYNPSFRLTCTELSAERTLKTMKRAIADSDLT